MSTIKPWDHSLAQTLAYEFKDYRGLKSCPVCGKHPVTTYRDYVNRNHVFKHSALRKEAGKPGKVKVTTFCMVPF